MILVIHLMSGYISHSYVFCSPEPLCVEFCGWSFVLMELLTFALFYCGTWSSCGMAMTMIIRQWYLWCMRLCDVWLCFSWFLLCSPEPLCVGNLKWHFWRSSRIFLLLYLECSWGWFRNRLITRVAQREVVAVSGSVDQSGSELKFSADEAAEVCSIFVCETWAYVAWCWYDYELQVDNSLALFDWIEFENACHAQVALQVTS
jgi:hypothetical protein